MDELKEKIKIKLRGFLNREPSEDEVVNSTKDPIIMGWIRDDEVKYQAIEIEKLKKSKPDIL